MALIDEENLIPDWSSQQSFVVVEPMLHLPWGGKRGKRARLHLSCGFCNHLFEPGETARWVGMPHGSNTFVCPDCDGPDVKQRWAQRWTEVIQPILNRWCGDGYE